LKSLVDQKIREFPNETRGDAKREVNQVRTIIQDLKKEMRSINPWKGLTEDEFTAERQKMEHYVFSTLYPIIFNKEEYKRKDEALNEKLRIIRPFLMPLVNVEPLQRVETTVAIDVLDSIDTCHAPFEKFATLYSVRNIINSSGYEGGAGDYLPILMFIIANSHLKTLYSNLQFLTNYAELHRDGTLAFDQSEDVVLYWECCLQNLRIICDYFARSTRESLFHENQIAVMESVHHMSVDSRSREYYQQNPEELAEYFQRNPDELRDYIKRQRRGINELFQLCLQITDNDQ